MIKLGQIILKGVNWTHTSLCVGDQYLNVRSICFFTCAVVVSSKCKENGSEDLRRSFTIILVKYGDRPSEIIYDELVQLRWKLAAILLSGNMTLNKSPRLSVDLKLKLLEATFASQKISAFWLSSPGRTIPRLLEVDGALSPDFTQETQNLLWVLSIICFVASLFFLFELCYTNWDFPALSHFILTSQKMEYPL